MTTATPISPSPQSEFNAEHAARVPASSNDTAWGARLLALSMRLQRLAWLLPVVVFLLAFVPRVLGLNVFLTADEDDQLRFAAGFLTAVLAGDWSEAVLLGYPGVPTMAFAGIGLGLRFLLHRWGVAPVPAEYPMAGASSLGDFLGQAVNYPLIFTPLARGVMVLVASLAIVLMYLLLRRLTGGRVAFLATMLIAFDPFFLANSRILHVDAPLTYFMFLSFLAFWLYLQDGKIGWLALSGLCGALATLSKTPGAFLAPILVVTGLIYAWVPSNGGEQPDRRQRWRRVRLAVVVWGVVALAGFFALWPSMWVDPLRAVRLIVNNALIAARTTHPSSGVFWGPTGADQSPFYYLISLPFHLAPLVGVGLLLGMAATWRWRRFRPLLLSLWTYAILFLVPVSFVGRRGDRYMLPIYLALDLLAALALYWVVRRRAMAVQLKMANMVDDSRPLRIRGESAMAQVGRALRSVQGWGRWVLVALVAIQIVFVLCFYPYFFDYLNPLVGGARFAPKLINIGWGEGLDQAAAFLNQQPDARNKTVAAWYSGQLSPFFEGRTIDLSQEEPALVSDYTVFYINQIQRGFPSRELLDYFADREPIHTVWMGGIEYARIYDGPMFGAKLPPEIPNSVDVTWDNSLHLAGFDLQRPDAHADTPMQITLFWEVFAWMSGDYNVYVRLVDDAGNVWGEVDRLPVGGLWRTDRWQPGAVIRDEYCLTLDPGTPPDVYWLEVAMYDFKTGETFGVGRNLGQVKVLAPRSVPESEVFTPQQVLRKTVAPGLELLGYDLGKEKIGPGERMPVTLYWRTTRPLNRDYSVVFDALSVAGNEGGRWDELLVPGDYPTSQWRWGEIVLGKYQLQMPASARSGFYVLNLRLADAGTGDLLSREILGKIEFLERPRSFQEPEMAQRVGMELDGVAQLVGYTLPVEKVVAGESFPLTLYWRALDETSTSYTVFVHVVGPDGIIRGQWDSVPGDGRMPTTGWLNGEVVTDPFIVPMEDNAPPWQYAIYVGMYDPLTGERLPVKGFPDQDEIPLTSVMGE